MPATASQVLVFGESIICAHWDHSGMIYGLAMQHTWLAHICSLLQHAAGRVRYNADAPSAEVYRNLVRLSPHQDDLEGALTVAQNVQLAAHLTLPPHFTPHRRSTLVEEVLDLLGLQAMQHCLVGTSASSGLILSCSTYPNSASVLTGPMQTLWSAHFLPTQAVEPV